MPVKKFLSILLIFTMVIGILSGCSEQPNETLPLTDQNQTSNNSGTQSTPSHTHEDETRPSKPEDDDTSEMIKECTVSAMEDITLSINGVKIHLGMTVSEVIASGAFLGFSDMNGMITIPGEQDCVLASIGQGDNNVIVFYISGLGEAVPFADATIVGFGIEGYDVPEGVELLVMGLPMNSTIDWFETVLGIASEDEDNPPRVAQWHDLLLTESNCTLYACITQASNKYIESIVVSLSDSL
jgi:hypothetical protein